MQQSVLLITGPAGSGKSTVAREWASSRDSACDHLPLDDFRELIKAEYQDPRLGWNDEAQRQLDLARSNIAAVSKNFLNSGVEVVVDDVAFPDWEASGLALWQVAMNPVKIDLVVLMPSWNVVAERNSARNDHDRLPEEMLRKIYDDMSGWRDRADVAVIDNSTLSVEETIVEIECVLTVDN